MGVANGAGDAAERYARLLLMSDEGARVSLDRISAAPRIAALDPAPVSPHAGALAGVSPEDMVPVFVPEPA